MLTRVGSMLCSTLASAVGGSRPLIYPLINVRDFSIAHNHVFRPSQNLLQTCKQHSAFQLHARRRGSSAPVRREVPQELEEPAPEPGGPISAEELAEIKNLLSQQDSNPAAPGVPQDQQQLLQVGVVGAPNAGKSTLTNGLVGTKVSAVSPKTNTTNVPMLGAWTQGTKQIVLFDTPGVVSPKQYRNAAQATRVSSAWGTAGDCDLVLFIVDVHRQALQQDPRVTQLVQDLGHTMAAIAEEHESAVPSVLVLNKVDLVKKEGPSAQQQMVKVAEQFNEMHQFEETFWVSALRNQGMSKLRDYLMARATAGIWLMDPQQKTDRPPEQIVREVVREKLYRNLHQEIPYNARVVPISFKELADGSWRFEQQIVVPTVHVRAMVIGKQGSVIGQIGKHARIELDAIFQRRTHLILNVKAEKKHG